MTQEQKRIKIAEACGYERRSDGAFRRVGMVGSCGIPDYFSDLNAMQSAVLSQDEKFQDRFDSLLKNSGRWIASMTAGEWADIFCGLLNADNIK